MMYDSILVLALSLTAQVPDGLTVKYNKFDDYTSIRMELKKNVEYKESYYISIYANHPGKEKKQLSEDTDVDIALYRRGSGWKYLHDHKVKMMVEDEHIPLSRQSYRSEIDDGKCHEFIHLYIPLKTLKEFLSKGKNWEVKIGVEEPFALDAKIRAKMRTFAKFIEEGGG